VILDRINVCFQILLNLLVWVFKASVFGVFEVDGFVVFPNI